MAAIESVRADIHVNELPLVTAPDKANSNTRKKAVFVVLPDSLPKGSEYSIHLHNAHPVETFKASIYIDGRMLPKHSFLQPGKQRSITGWPVTDSSERPLCFGKIQVDAETAIDDQRDKAMGLIRIEWRRAELTGWTQRREWDFERGGAGVDRYEENAPQSRNRMNEQSKKGSFVSHGTTFGQERYLRTKRDGDIPKFTVHEKDQDIPYRVIEMRYRARRLLEAGGLIASQSSTESNRARGDDDLDFDVGSMYSSYDRKPQKKPLGDPALDYFPRKKKKKVEDFQPAKETVTVLDSDEEDQLLEQQQQQQQRNNYGDNYSNSSNYNGGGYGNGNSSYGNGNSGWSTNNTSLYGNYGSGGGYGNSNGRNNGGGYGYEASGDGAESGYGGSPPNSNNGWNKQQQQQQNYNSNSWNNGSYGSGRNTRSDWGNPQDGNYYDNGSSNGAFNSGRNKRKQPDHNGW
ncbi:hypothetical protein RI367_006024 [Sorochytrium milnesiophthora]